METRRLLASVLIILSACGGETTDVCPAMEELQASVQVLTRFKPARIDSQEVERAVRKVFDDLDRVNAASDELNDEVQALRRAAEALESAFRQFDQSLSEASAVINLFRFTEAQMATESAWEALKRAATPLGCDLS
jgi:uncharacterized coiled-coil DUF342 family protein